MPQPDPMTALFASIPAIVMKPILWVVPALLALVALKALLLPRLRGMAGEARVARMLDRLGAEALHDIILPDGRGGRTQIDHVVLTGAGLLVVETKNYSGSIYGQAGEAQWTQRLGRQSFRFQNPLRQNYAHTQAVQTLLPGVRVLGRVVFVGDARFPKGMPEGVATLGALRHELRELNSEAPPDTDLRSAWERLKATAQRDRQARKAHLAGVREKRGPDRRRYGAWGLLAVAAIWVAAIWVWPASEGPSRAGADRQTIAAAVPAPARPLPPSLPTTPAPTVAIAAPAAVTFPNSQRSTAPAPSASTADCNSAIAAVLIDNSAENRRQRDRACGANGTDAQ